MNETIMNLVLTICAAVTTGLISIGVAWLQSKIKNENLNMALARLADSAIVSTGEAQQLFVDGWKDENNGELTPEKIQKLGKDVLALTLQKMDKPSIELINAAGIEIEAVIKGYVEDTVRKFKTEDKMLINNALSTKNVVPKKE